MRETGEAPTNLDPDTVRGFGEEWSHFTQASLSAEERSRVFSEYFGIFEWDRLPAGGGVGVDVGCGSGRWAALVAPRVRQLHLVDASAEALGIARHNLAGQPNVTFHHASVDALPFADESLDFGYSLGVLHHVPDTQAALRAIARKLKPGAPFLVYLYYAFDNRPWWFRTLWRSTDVMRRGISRMPWPLRYGVSQLFAFGVYWPLARVARVLETAGHLPGAWPLAYYRDKSLYVMRTDALDRFGTRLEQRFTREEIEGMLRSAGFEGTRFSPHPPFWCAVATRR